MEERVIHISPEILSGTPVFRGTRVPIKNLFDYLECGDSIENFIEDFPTVPRGDVIALLESAERSLIPSEFLHEDLA